MKNIEYEKITIARLKKEIKEKGFWMGIVAGNKLNERSFEEGWQLGNFVTFKDVVGMIQFTNSMLYYLPRELGNRIAFYNRNENINN